MLRRIRLIVPMLLVLGVIFASTRNAEDAEAAPPQAKWTVMVYMSGDNDLEEYISTDLETELAAPGSSANVQVVALADRGPGYDKTHGDWKSTKLFHVTPGMAALPGSAVADWGERDMGNPQTLVDFVSWSKANYPADHYALYFWGHGWSWHPEYVMQDDTDADTLDYHEMKPIMNTLGFIDVVGYDGCNMASIEIQQLWHGHATALAASQEWVGWDGIEYDVVLNQLTATPSMTADQVAVATAQSASNEKTFSAVAVDSRWNAFKTTVDAFGTAMKNGAAANRPAMRNAFNATRSMWQAPIDKDLYDMAFEIKAKVNDANIKAKAQAVITAMGPIVLYERHANQYADAHGITIFHISKPADKTAAWINWSYYPTTDWAATTQWDEFLNAWAS
ncbi:MAG TPA: clostripain-related cysteine peptidase [Actinomycetota bacterium]